MCDEGTMDNDRSGNYLKIPDDNVNLVETPCAENTPLTTCDTASDVCVTYTLDYYYYAVGTPYSVRVSRNRCGVRSEITVEGEHAYCDEFDTWFRAIEGSEYNEVNSCEAEVTKERETKGEEGGKDCRNEMCSGGETVQLNFILVVGSLVLCALV